MELKQVKKGSRLTETIINRPVRFFGRANVLFEKLLKMRRFKSSKTEFDRGKKKEMEEKKQKMTRDKPKYHERQLERQRKKQLWQFLERVRKRLEEFIEQTRIELMKQGGEKI